MKTRDEGNILIRKIVTFRLPSFKKPAFFAVRQTDDEKNFANFDLFDGTNDYAIWRWVAISSCFTIIKVSKFLIRLRIYIYLKLNIHLSIYLSI